mgnify:FL=1
MKILLTITLSLLLFSCNNPIVSFKKSCDRQAAKEKVEALVEVQEKIKQVERLMGKDRLYWEQDSVQQADKTYYRFRLLTKAPFVEKQLYTFWVDKNDCKAIFLEAKADSLVPYKEVEKQRLQQAKQPRQFPAFFKQFAADIAFRQQHVGEYLMNFSVEKDGSIVTTEEELLTLPIDELQTYTFTYYPDNVCCEHTDTHQILVFVPVGNTWQLTQVVTNNR